MNEIKDCVEGGAGTCRNEAMIEGLLLEIADGQWTSNIEQSSDRVLSLVRPINYEAEGEMFGKMKVEGRNQLLISLLKQKLGPANIPIWAFFQPEYNKLSDLEMTHAN